MPRIRPFHVARFARALCLLVLVFSMVVGYARTSSATERVALLIGNAVYRNPELALRNPPNDVKGLAAALDRLGFAVTRLIDADRATVVAALDSFEASATGADMALIFYAGHGVQVEGANHLLTAGFQALTPDELARESITLSDFSARLRRARPGIGLVILDACRTNPFSDSGQATRGLALEQGGPGILVAYATDPGKVAYDGLADNSFFTGALIEHIGAPGVEARLLFGRVRQQVAMDTQGRQVPRVEEAVLGGEHYFNPTLAAPSLEAGLARDVHSWRGASAEGSRTAYERYLADFPGGLFASFAQERLARLETSIDGASTGSDSDLRLLLAGAKRPQVLAALSTLGFLSQTRGQTPSDPVSDAELKAALANYASQMTNDGAVDLDRLSLDAAQVIVFLGAATGQRIRTDLTALKGIEIICDMTRDWRAELVALAPADPALGGADADIAAIEMKREKVLRRLDQSRTYYAELMQRGRADFGPYLTRSLAGLIEKARTLPAFEERFVTDADAFIRHATDIGAGPAGGSYAWIAEFLPRD